VIFQPAAGATVTLANSTLTVSGAHVEFHDLQMSRAGCTNTRVAPPCPQLVVQFPAHDVLVDSFQASRFSITGAYNVTIRNSDFGSSWDNQGVIHATTAGNRPHDITLVNDAVHDQWNSSACKAQAGCVSAHHIGCGPTINDAYNVLEDHMRFSNCEDLGQLVKPYRFANQNITIQNSSFGASHGTYSLGLANVAATPEQGLHIRNNTFAKGISVTQGIRYPNSDLTGNVVPSLVCSVLASDGFTLSNNATSAGGAVLCGAGNQPAPTPMPPPPPGTSPPPPPPPSSPPSGGGGSTTGVSQATCSGGACTNGTAPSTTVDHVVIASGNFSYYTPNGLTGKAPVLFELGGGGNCGSISFVWGNLAWQAALNSHRYMAVVLACPNGSSWDHAEDSSRPASGTDTAYIAAVANYVCAHTFNGVTPDCSRLYLTSGSSGGHETRAVMCSATTVGLFRGVSIVSAGAYTSDFVTGKCFSQSDKTIFVQYMGGASSMDPYLDNPSLGIMGFVGTVAWTASYLGCNATPSKTVVGTVTFANYAGCGYGKSPQFQSVFVANGGHSYPGLDSALGRPGWTAQQAATFFDGTTT
jgi:poly(3-hydroxybutyrate) depolymerase